MTRILATGDTHLGMPALNLADQEAVLNRIIDVALTEHVDLVLHGGDLFEGPTTTPEQVRVALNAIARLRDAGIPVLVISGNGKHDLAMRDVNGLDLFHDIPGIHVSSRPQVLPLAGVQIVTLPWTSPARLIANANGGLDRDRINERVGELLVETAARMLEAAREALQDWPKVLLAHWSISSGALPNGLPVADMGGPVLEWAELDALGFDLVIAAHIHKAQRLDSAAAGDATVGLYVGSPQPLNHGEEGDEHGVWIIDVEEGAISTGFVPIESPPFITIDFDFTERQHTADEIARASGMPEASNGAGTFILNQFVAEQVKPDAILRVRYRCTEAQARGFDQGRAREFFVAAGARSVEFKPQIIRETRARSETLTDQLSPLEALLAYCQAQDVEPEVTERMGERLRDWMTA